MCNFSSSLRSLPSSTLHRIYILLEGLVSSQYFAIWYKVQMNYYGWMLNRVCTLNDILHHLCEFVSITDFPNSISCIFGCWENKEHPAITWKLAYLSIVVGIVVVVVVIVNSFGRYYQVTTHSIRSHIHLLTFYRRRRKTINGSLSVADVCNVHTYTHFKLIWFRHYDISSTLLIRIIVRWIQGDLLVFNVTTIFCARQHKHTHTRRHNSFFFLNVHDIARKIRTCI